MITSSGLFYSRGFKYYLYANEYQMYICTLDLYPKFQISQHLHLSVLKQSWRLCFRKWWSSLYCIVIIMNSGQNLKTQLFGETRENKSRQKLDGSQPLTEGRCSG